jgi:F-type H+-transporting ATPase subunit b
MLRRTRQPCAARRRGQALRQLALGVALAALMWGAGLAPARFAPPLEASMQQPPPAGEHASPAAAEGHEGSPATEGHGAQEAEADNGLWMMLGKIVNSALLVATLVYFLRPPVRQYLADRTAQVRQDLVTAAGMRAAAGAELEKLERRLAELPGDIEALRQRGAHELADEEARIRQTTDVLRDRLVGQTRREIDLQAMMAERELLERTADIAVRVAAERIRRDVTDRDQLRLIDRYVEQVRTES